jgi:hypothetical protein
LNTKTIIWAIFFLIAHVNIVSHAQSSFQIGGLPSLNLNKKLKNDWSINARVESRLRFQRGQINGAIDKEFNYVLTDFSLIAAKRIGLNSRVAGGYLIRFEDGDIQHRFIQQFVIVQKFSAFRLSHRLVTDQTFSSVESPEFRLRYRISSEIPLNGESVDPGEFYVRINNEYLNSLQAATYDLEVRLVSLIGYDISDKFKVESGLDYRVNSFLLNRTRHSYWMAINFFIDLK